MIDIYWYTWLIYDFRNKPFHKTQIPLPQRLLGLAHILFLAKTTGHQIDHLQKKMLLQTNRCQRKFYKINGCKWKFYKPIGASESFTNPIWQCKWKFYKPWHLCKWKFFKPNHWCIERFTNQSFVSVKVLQTRASVQVTGVIILYRRLVTVEMNSEPWNRTNSYTY